MQDTGLSNNLAAVIVPSMELEYKQIVLLTDNNLKITVYLESQILAVLLKNLTGT